MLDTAEWKTTWQRGSDIHQGHELQSHPRCFRHETRWKNIPQGFIVIRSLLWPFQYGWCWFVSVLMELLINNFINHLASYSHWDGLCCFHPDVQRGEINLPRMVLCYFRFLYLYTCGLRICFLSVTVGFPHYSNTKAKVSIIYEDTDFRLSLSQHRLALESGVAWYYSWLIFTIWH